MYNGFMSQVIILGAKGMLGTDIVSVLTLDGHQVHALGSQDIDISNPISVDTALSAYSKANILINCAAYTKVDQAETEFDRAQAINGFGVGNVARWCKTHQIEMIHFSTDYVFNGLKPTPYIETDPTCPINRYGESKLKGETEFLESGVQGYLFRVQWLYGHNGSHFIKTISRLAKERATLSVVADQWGSPTWTIEIARMISQLLLHKPPYGIYHFASDGYTNWADFAKYFLSLQNSPCDIISIPSYQYPTPATRPLQSRMDISQWLSLGVYSPLTWQKSVQLFLKEEH